LSGTIDEIFRRAKEGRALFLDHNALNPDYIPEKLPFRDSQIRSVAQVLAPILHISKPSNLLLYGKTGTGKTAVTRYVLARLKRETGTDELITAYVNTRLANTEYRTLSDFAKFLDLPPEKQIPFTGLSMGEVMNRIFAEIKSKEAKVVLVLDEIDYLVKTYGDEVLYEFTRSNDRLTPGFLSIVGISNDLRFKEGLDPRVLSSLSEEELVFPPYTVDELRQILQQRAGIAFKPAAVLESAINLCAAIAGSEHGDARRAVDLLRVAGEVAEREGLIQVDDSCVKRASDKMEHDRVEEAIRSLPVQTKAILLAASRFEAGTNTGELFLTYSNLCKRVGLETLTQRRVSGILAELDLMGLVEASVVSKGRRGRTKRIRFLIGVEVLMRTLSEDTTFASFL
jgi:archaeal cell division control protein 6